MGGRRGHHLYIFLSPMRTTDPTRMQRPPESSTSAALTPPLWRRLFHMGACSSIPLVAIFASGGLMVVLMAVLSGLALSIEGARLRLPKLNRLLLAWLRPLLKETEDLKITGATYIALSSLAVFLLFDKPIAIAAIFFLSLGDPVAALVGKRLGGPRLFGKSPSGTLAFFGVAVAVAGVLSAGGVVSFGWALVAGAAVAAVVELVPLVLDDNLTIPLVSGAAMSLMGV